MNPSLIRNPPALTTASRTGMAQRCSSRIRAAAVSLGMSSSTSQAPASSRIESPSWAAVGAGECARFGTFFAGEPEADEGADRGAHLDGLIFSEVAEVFGLEVAVGVLVDGQSIYYADGVALPKFL